MNGRQIFQRVLLSLAVLCVGGESAVSGEETDSFMQELNLLRQQRVAEVGKGPLVQAYEKFIDKHSVDPRRSEAIFDLGSLYEIKNTDAGIWPEPELALKWYRRAAEAAAPGSEAWLQIQQLVINRVSSPAEKRAIIELMSRHAGNDLALQVQIEKNLMDVCVLERNYDEAAEHCRRIMNWYDDPAKVPSDLSVKSKIDSEMLSAANEFVVRLAESPLPKAERKQRIEEFAKKFPHNQEIYLRDLNRARKQSDARRENRPPFLNARESYAQLIFIGINVLVIVALIGYFIRRKLVQG